MVKVCVYKIKMCDVNSSILVSLLWRTNGSCDSPSVVESFVALFVFEMGSSCFPGWSRPPRLKQPSFASASLVSWDYMYTYTTLYLAFIGFFPILRHRCTYNIFPFNNIFRIFFYRILTFMVCREAQNSF